MRRPRYRTQDLLVSIKAKFSLRTIKVGYFVQDDCRVYAGHRTQSPCPPRYGSSLADLPSVQCHPVEIESNKTTWTTLSKLDLRCHKALDHGQFMRPL